MGWVEGENGGVIKTTGGVCKLELRGWKVSPRKRLRRLERDGMELEGTPDIRRSVLDMCAT